MKTYNNQRAESLGMPWGTANNRLRKLILFHLLCKLGENVCFVCKKPIESVEVLSIEHKEPWQGRDPKLFWDMDNISFSHLRCNQPHMRNSFPPPPRRFNDGVQCLCLVCDKIKPVEDFAKNVTRWDGLAADCRDCQKKHKDKMRYGVVAESG